MKTFAGIGEAENEIKLEESGEPGGVSKSTVCRIESSSVEEWELQREQSAGEGDSSRSRDPHIPDSRNELIAFEVAEFLLALRFQR